MIFITNTMKQASCKTGSSWRRAVFVVGALLCLCVSDSAGPRLLPLPALSVPPAVSTFRPAGDGCLSRSPSPNREPNAYFQMVAGSHHRGRDRQHDVQPMAHPPAVSCQLQPSALATTPDTYASLNFKTAPLSIPKGRAPPRFS